jgi:hypothetical protein
MTFKVIYAWKWELGFEEVSSYTIEAFDYMEAESWARQLMSSMDKNIVLKSVKQVEGN